MKNKRFQIIWRYGLVSLGITAVAIGIIASVFNTTVVEADNWNAKAEAVLSRVEFVQPRRGEILACDGTVLATNITKYTIMLDYRATAPRDTDFIKDLGPLCDSMAAYYPVRTRAEWLDHLARPLKDAPSRRRTSHVLLKDANYSDYLRILDFPFFSTYKKSRYKHGLHLDSREIRVMPYGSMARRSIGRCSYVHEPITENPTKRSDSVDVLHGYSGLEKALDSLLYGSCGTTRTVQLTHGMRKWVDKPAVNGYSVKTTIDITMQDIVENELHDMLRSVDADWGTCLLMEVATGDIKAISNLDRAKDGTYTEAMNYALQAYEPGSVMKPISMLVALEDGYAFPLNKSYQIGKSYAYAGGTPIHDSHSPASLTVSQFIEYSSNIGMTKLITPHYENNLNGFRDRLKELGFFDRFNTHMAGERTPYFPTLSVSNGGRVSLSRMAYGYSTQIPPLYICAIYNAIANDGKFVRPRMVKEIIDCYGNVEEQPVTYVREQVCTPENAAILREMLHGVVYGKGGTAQTLRNDIVCVVGKTGTSRIALESKRDSTGKVIKYAKGYREGAYRLAFCGFFPYENPKYTCMVLVSNPTTGLGAARISGTVVKNIALKLFARGLLDNSSKYDEERTHNSRPVLYASNSPLARAAQTFMGVSATDHFVCPAIHAGDVVPDVKGMGLREAVARIEDAGYNINISGTGYACRQTPAAGTPLPPGKTISVQFVTR